MFLNKPIKLEFKSVGKYAGWRLLSIFLMGVLLTASLFTYYFIYNNIYTTLADANAVVALNSQIGGEAIDQAAYEEANALQLTKTSEFNIPTSTRDFFQNKDILMYEQTTSTTSTAKKT